MNNKSPHKNLDAWKVSMKLVEITYKLTSGFPSEEKFGLCSQMRRAAISVPSNIAEGAADRTKDQFINYLSNAVGSLSELDTQLELSFRLGYINENEYQNVFQQLDKTKALVFGLKKSLQRNE
ncbi:four helix bundle protein [Gracilimonas sp. Q87]|uniref:four helix bundle protein n=1 Tax=Gracilimonas sp. Q87 TaxID=3384766 RepID=UPI0039843383